MSRHDGKKLAAPRSKEQSFPRGPRPDARSVESTVFTVRGSVVETPDGFKLRF
jgi:hypothetical protein